MKKKKKKGAQTDGLLASGIHNKIRRRQPKSSESEREISADCSSIPCACEESREKRRRNVIIIIYYVSPSLSQVFMYV
jgi:hypothetical protein